MDESGLNDGRDSSRRVAGYRAIAAILSRMSPAVPDNCCRPPRPLSGDSAVPVRVSAGVADPRDLLRGVRQSAGQAGGLRARRARGRRRCHAAAVLRSGALPGRPVRSAGLRAQPAPRRVAREHDPGPGRRHGAPARGARHRALARVRRFLGQHARARVRRDAPRQGHRHSCCAASSCCGRPSCTGSISTGASEIFPDRWEEYLKPIPVEERGDLLRAYHRRLTGRDEAAALAAARAWSIWEGATSHLFESEKTVARFGADEFALALARIEAHYFVNGGFLEVAGPDPARRRAHPRRFPASSCRAAMTSCAR